MKSPAEPPPCAWAMSMAARKSGSATASAGDVEDDGEGDPQAAEAGSPRRASPPPPTSLASSAATSSAGAEHARGRARSGESATAASPATMATTKVSPTRARHERRELRRVQLRELGGDEEVGEGGADNG